ncbi:MAG: tRNA nucleotidyltransferase [Clostridia bacterium]|nr:tRNA nucleotidyltransferase [Clostridia bacterium]
MEFELPGAVAALIDALERVGYPAYAVGGCVRDWLMGRPPHDYDICTAATPEQMRAALPGIRLLPTGEAHGTLTALVDGASYELTAFRVDGAYADHRRPDAVRYVSDLRQDLARRDFTINAVAYHPSRGLVDPFGGREDVARRLVRCVGDPAERFREDALRVLRALRFAAACDFDVEPATAAAALAARHTLAWVARERIFGELTRLLCAPAPHRGLLGFAPALAAAAPGLASLAESGGGWALAARRVCAAPDSAAERWAALLWDLPDAAPDLLRGLRCDNATRERVEALLAARDLPLTPERAVLLRALRRLGPEAAHQLAALRRADRAARGCAAAGDDRIPAALAALLEENPCYRVAHLAVGGADLLALGLRGPEVGRALAGLLDAVIEGRVENRREALLAHVSGGSGA